MKSGKPVPSFKTVAEKWEGICRKDIQPQSWMTYLPHYKAVIMEFGNRLITDLTATDINNCLLKAKAQNYSLSAVKVRKTILTQILNTAVVDGYLNYNPALSVKMPKNLKHGTRRAPTEEEVDIIVDSVETVPFGFFAYFLLFTGLRKGEALALTRNDIDLKNKTIYINKSLEYMAGSGPQIKAPKTEAGRRFVPVVMALHTKLLWYLDTLDGDILFPTPKTNHTGGGYLTKYHYQKLWNNYCAVTGLDLTAHNLRHGMATILFEAGVDSYTTKTIMGHANITTTMQIYTELRAKQMVKSVYKFEEETRKYLQE